MTISKYVSQTPAPMDLKQFLQTPRPVPPAVFNMQRQIFDSGFSAPVSTQTKIAQRFGTSGKRDPNQRPSFFPADGRLQRTSN